jgi:hypothetical protein
MAPPRQTGFDQTPSGNNKSTGGIKTLIFNIGTTKYIFKLRHYRLFVMKQT